MDSRFPAVELTDASNVSINDRIESVCGSIAEAKLLDMS